MMNDHLKKVAPIILILAVLASVFFVGVHVGKNEFGNSSNAANVINKDKDAPITVDFGPFWKAWSILNEKFVSKEPIDEQKKIWGSISGLAESLGDPYTVFFPPEENKSFQSEIAGNFEGVGMEIAIQDGTLTVVTPLRGSPAEKAGIKAKDKILKIDNTSTQDITVEKAVKLIRGKGGTTVTLSIRRNGVNNTFPVKIMRGTIEIPTLDTEIIKPEGKDPVFVIKLYNFNANANGLFRNALRQFITSGTPKLVLDLRNNPGGYLESAVDMASFFLPAGKVVVTEDYGKSGKPKEHRSRGYDVFNSNLKMVILVNEGSASASEILAGALQDHGKAVIFGRKTFGKGSVQELVPITAETSLKVTIARWLTPKGKSISEGGLSPDVELSSKEMEVREGKDIPLDKAVEYLNK